MTTAPFPAAQIADQARDRARQITPGRVAVTVIGAVFAVLGWIAGRNLVCLGWIAGRTWLALAYMAEAVVYGFRNGAGLPLPQTRSEQPPAR
jgi:hypothetical protein